MAIPTKPPKSPFETFSLVPISLTAALEVVALAALEVVGDSLLELPGAEVEAIADVAAVVWIVIVPSASLLAVEEACVLEAAEDVFVGVLEDLSAVVVSEDSEDESATTLNPRRSLEASLEKFSVALPDDFPLHLELSKRSMLMPLSPLESILNRLPSGLSISIQSLGPWPVRL